MRAFRGARPVQRRLIVPLLLATLAVSRGHAEPLAVFVHNIVGARLMVSPAALYVPKNIPGSLAVTIASSDGGPHPKSASLGIGRHVEAVLRGPAFPTGVASCIESRSQRGQGSRERRIARPA